MALLSYHLYACFMLSNEDGDLEWCENAIDEELRTYPNGIWFLFYKGRLELVKGNIEDSIEWYKKSWKSQNSWPQFHCGCYWELMWAHCITQQWDEAAEYASMLFNESKWSRTTYIYQKAAILLMKNPNNEEKCIIDELMTQAPAYTQRIAGKALPFEKYIVKKADRYFAQKKKLILPVYELMYLWNLYIIIGKRRDLIVNMYKKIEDEEKELNSLP